VTLTRRKSATSLINSERDIPASSASCCGPGARPHPLQTTVQSCRSRAQEYPSTETSFHHASGRVRPLRHTAAVEAGVWTDLVWRRGRDAHGSGSDGDGARCVSSERWAQAR
jgi:hypothetical protein